MMTAPGAGAFLLAISQPEVRGVVRNDIKVKPSIVEDGLLRILEYPGGAHMRDLRGIGREGHEPQGRGRRNDSAADAPELPVRIGPLF